MNDTRLTQSAKGILRISVFSVFLGRAWHHLFWDAPYRTLFWDEELLEPLIENIFNISWSTYVTADSTDLWIQNCVFYTGILYVLGAISVLFYEHYRLKIMKYIILFGGVNLVFLSFLLTKEKFYHFAQFFEHGIQFSLPFIFVYTFGERFKIKNLVFFVKILVAIVFVSHGLYAIGYYPVPGNFIDMVMSILSVSESSARTFLSIAGFLDFLVAFCIFVPKTTQVALWYAFTWGTLTALARVVSGFQFNFPWQSIHQEMYETVYRFAHGLLPLFLLIIHRKNKFLEKNRMKETV